METFAAQYDIATLMSRGKLHWDAERAIRSQTPLERDTLAYTVAKMCNSTDDVAVFLNRFYQADQS